MKVFALNIANALVVVIMLAFLLEWAFNYCYYNPKYPRSKISSIKNPEIEETIDYAFIGSSRCINYINELQINESTWLNGHNFGYRACNPFEIKLTALELLKSRNVRRILVQVDKSFDEELPDSMAMVEWIPYLKEPEISGQFASYFDVIGIMKNLPFYRYMKYESQIGFRNVLLSMFGKERTFMRYKVCSSA